MLAAVIEGPGAVVVRDTAPPRATGLALVRVTRAGICGTDRALAAEGVPARPPRVLGHEMTGRVEVPSPGGAVPAGTPVVVNPAAFCGACRECRRDLPNLCARGGLLGRDLDGCFAEYVAVPESLLHPLPEGITADEAVLLQVLSTCVHAQPPAADSAVVVGLGVTGLLHVQLLRDQGVPTIVGVTRAAGKRDHRDPALRGTAGGARPADHRAVPARRGGAGAGCQRAPGASEDRPGRGRAMTQAP